MAPIRPPKSKNTSFTGFKPAALIEVTDRSDVSDKLDFILDFQMEIEECDFPLTMSLTGSFEKDIHEKIVPNSSAVKRIYRVLDGMNEEGGVNADGQWVDGEDNPVDNFALYLTKKHTMTPGQYPYKVYVYKEKPRVPGGKSYMRIYPMIVPNDANGTKEIESFIAYMKKKGFLQEEGDVSPSQPQTQPSNTTNSPYGKGAF